MHTCPVRCDVVRDLKVCGDIHASEHRSEQTSHETTVKAPETAQTKAACIDDVAKSLSQNGYGQSPISEHRPFAHYFSFLACQQR
eukprot:COSAG02_NODE_1773_length_10980_cov_8.196765_12_plen_85_part_00